MYSTGMSARDGLGATGIYFFRLGEGVQIMNEIEIGTLNEEKKMVLASIRSSFQERPADAKKASEKINGSAAAGTRS